MLETLLWQAVSSDPAIPCINTFMECVRLETGVSPSTFDKGRALAFLASRAPVKPLIGHAARAGYWKFESLAYDDLKRFPASM